jgi:hypothetical protein
LLVLPDLLARRELTEANCGDSCINRYYSSA